MKPVSFYLVTDTHYFEPSLGASGKAFDNHMRKEQYFMRESSAIVKATFEKIAADKTVDTVLIPGDLSKNGEIESHREFIALLDELRESGKNVYVVTADHETGGITLKNGSYVFTKDDHSAANVPVLVYGSKEIITDGETVKNYEIPTRIAYALGFEEAQFPVSVKN